MRTSMSPSKSSHSWTTASRYFLYCEVCAIFRCSSRLPSSCCSSSSSLALISLSRARHSACSSLDFFSPFSMLASSSCSDFSFSRKCRRSFAWFLTKRSSLSLQAASRSSTLARVASSALAASRSMLSIFSSCVLWFSSWRALRMPRSLAIFPSSTFFHSSLTSLRQCLSRKAAVTLALALSASFRSFAGTSWPCEAEACG
mmetsp:Transcript_102520/g.289917  ORF Transcript_102520/g.289917 Transcript_102520/m.289917 type:complete len:201 (-) Transcript_102520:31-633(-)